MTHTCAPDGHRWSRHDITDLLGNPWTSWFCHTCQLYAELPGTHPDQAPTPEAERKLGIRRAHLRSVRPVPRHQAGG